MDDATLPLTDLPTFNQLQEECARFVEGRRDGAEVLETLDLVDLVVGGMFGRFFEELPFHEETALLAEVSIEMDAAFGPLREALLALRAALESAARPAAEAALATAHAGVQRACAALARLREEWSAQPSYSESPWTQELVRVARLHLRGRLPVASFQLRFERFVQYHHDLEAGLATLAPGPRERDVAEQMTPRIQAALRQEAEALTLLAEFFDDLKVARVEPALEMLLSAAETLVEAQRAILAEGERAETLPCVRCGQENERSARFCRRCSAMLLRAAPSAEVGAGEALDLLDSGQAPSAPIQAEAVGRLEEAVEGVLAGQEPGSLEALLTELEASTARVAADLGRMRDPDAQTPADQLDVFRRSRAALGDGTARMREALGILRQFLEQGDPGLARAGVLAFRAGADQALEVQRIWEQFMATQQALARLGAD